MTDEPRARVDLHLHSHASNVTDYYAANAFAIPESYSEPRALYQLLRQRGMSLVTLTDHNSIDGVRELLSAGLPDVFISAELTTTFPHDGCNIHITVANVTEAQFAEADRLRGNVHELIAYRADQILRLLPRAPRLLVLERRLEQATCALQLRRRQHRRAPCPEYGLAAAHWQAHHRRRA